MALQDVKPIPPEEKPRKTGIKAVGAVPWGMHLCSFYDTEQDLIDILVPYFKAGLENNESCIWVTSEPLGEKEAEEAIRKTVPDFAQYLERGQIEIIPHTDWYLKGGTFNRQRVLNSWVDKLNQALVKGYDGIRVAGNTAWLEEKDWADFTEYEEKINDVIGDYHMLVICTYSLNKCGPSQITDVVSNHQATLIRRAGKLVLVRSSEHERVQRDLNEREKELRCLYDVTDVADVAERLGITLDELYQEVVNLLPSSWQYQEITCARITINGKEFKTERCRDRCLKWKQSSEIRVFGTKVGEVQVNYLEKKPEIGEGPFLKEERLLLDEIARQLGQITERRQADDNPGKTSDEDRLKEQNRMASLQKRFVRSGFDALEEEDEIRLVFSLCRYHPECDEEIEKCIKNFKDLRELLSASEGKLQRIGICPRGVFTIRLLRELPEEVLKQKILEKPVYKSPQEIFEYLRYSMRDLEKEVFKVIYLDKRDKIIDTIDLFEGTLDSIPIRPREIMESAIAHNATGLIFAHNHPTGDPAPSKTDKQLTRELVFVGMIMRIKVLDHIIIGEDRYFSFADEKLIEKYEDDFLNLKIRAAFYTEVHPTLSLK